MRTGKDLILATRVFAKENRSQSWNYTLTTLSILISMLLGTYCNLHLVIRIICSIVSVLAFSRMFVIYHDFMHETILGKSRVANIIFYVFGLFTLAPNSIWKRSHGHHHKHNSKLFTADIGSYPIMTKEQFLNAPKNVKKAYLAARHPLTILFGYLTMFLYGMCIRSFIKNPSKHFDSLLAVLLHIGFGVVLYLTGGITALLLTMIVPFTLTFALGAYLFYAQHNFPGVEFKKNIEWSFEHAALQSSSFMKMGKVMQWATANIGYHHIHHLNSNIPFYRLPEVMAYFPELQQATPTSLHCRDIIACLQLKVWDPEQRRMLRQDEINMPTSSDLASGSSNPVFKLA